MNSFLLNRQLGSISHSSLAIAQSNRLLRSIQPATRVHFNSKTEDHDGEAAASQSIAHHAGVNSISVDPFEGRYLLSAGADSSIAIWDLEVEAHSGADSITHTPLDRVARTSTTHALGINHISFYPFDSLAFLTSGYDQTLKVFSSETLQSSATFNLDSIVYSHAVSGVASHLLVACASQHPTVRLVDLRSGSNTHSLAGHSGHVLVVTWHPSNENILASGATDGCLRLWDVRRSASSLGVLDMEDSIGIAGYDGKGTGARRRERGRAHNGAVNGISWTSNGQFLVSIGHDERMRVWNMSTGANTLVNFGPGLKNSQNSVLFPLLAPSHLSPAGQEVVFFPNPREILSFDLHSGTPISRMRIPGIPTPGSSTTFGRNLKPKAGCLAWRARDIEMYSSHSDGVIRCWRPRTTEDVESEREEKVEAGGDEVEGEKKRKREELEQIVNDLTRKRTTYS